jgi:hypothetical protein
MAGLLSFLNNSQKTSSYSEVIPEDIMSWDDWRKRSESLFFFCNVVLSTVFGDKFQNFGIIHRHLCRFLTGPSRRKFISVFRGSFKTTVLLGYCVYLYCWAVANNTPISICYNTATKENAEHFMEDFREILRSSKLLRWIFPELPAVKEFRIWRKWKVEYKDFKFHVSSLETATVSRHYTVMINDDLVNDLNSESELERKKIIKSWRYQKSVLTKYKKLGIGLEVDVGTPYHSQDLISYIYKKVKSYDKFVVPYKLDGYLTFPEMYTWDDFSDKRDDQGASIFATQYELVVLEEADRLLKEEWVRYWKQLPQIYRRYMIVDPAGTEESRNCPTGIVIFDINEAGVIFLVYAEELWLTPRGLINKTKELKEVYDPDEIYFEKEKYSVTIADTMEHLAPRLEFSFVTPKNRRKVDRILKLKQKFETKRILFAEGMKTLIDRGVTFPDSEYVDMLDALAYGAEIAIPPPRSSRYGRRGENKERELDEFEKELHQIQEVMNRRENYDAYF